LLYHPGETNVRMADVVVINKVDSAEAHNVERVLENVESVNLMATVVFAKSPPTLTRALICSARTFSLSRTTDPHARRDAVRSRPRRSSGKPARRRSSTRAPMRSGRSKTSSSAGRSWSERSCSAMGYGEQQLADLEATINAADCDVVVTGTRSISAA
jgi:predicted GTPase